jgi:hypothetical protein
MEKRGNHSKFAAIVCNKKSQQKKKSKQRKENRAPVEINTNFSDEISTKYLFCKR